MFYAGRKKQRDELRSKVVPAEDNNNLFSVLGVLRVVRELDYEVTDQFLLWVEAIDPSSGLFSRSYLFVNVTDVNDQPPQFARDSYQFAVSEAAKIGSTLGNFSVVGPVTYELSDTFGGTLALNASSGMLTLARNLDFEAVNQYQFHILARDNHPKNPLSAAVLVTLNILNVNDNRPSFQNSCPLKILVPADVTHGLTVARLVASDLDGDQLSYSILANLLSLPVKFASSDEGSLVWAPERLLSSSLFRFQVLVFDGLHSTECEVEMEVDGSLKMDDLPRFTAENRSVVISIDQTNALGSLVHRIESPLGVNSGLPVPVSYSIRSCHYWRSTVGAAHFCDQEKKPFDIGLDNGQLLQKLRSYSVLFIHRCSSLDSLVPGQITVIQALEQNVIQYRLLIEAAAGNGFSDFVELFIKVYGFKPKPRFLLDDYRLTLTPSMYKKNESWPTPRLLDFQIHRPELATSEMQYRLLETDFFEIEQQTGFLKLNSLFDVPSPQEVGTTGLLLVAQFCLPEDSSSCASANVTVMFHNEELATPKLFCNSYPVTEVCSAINNLPRL
ncbi:bahd acyltransferase [Cichlidogyrus casuarinus]|uniref:Bahd acyltransferase n=1 Tax=Cichlidogyrus casuarinus TaxID=1844966 RepID=A0ABD2QLS2_9PLAT